MSEPAADGRKGRVSAGCVFWADGAERTFSTVPDDHGNCSVGSLTHGLKTLEEVSGSDGVLSLLASGWVKSDMVPEDTDGFQEARVNRLWPLADSRADPDVILLKVNGRQLMVLSGLYAAKRGVR